MCIVCIVCSPKGKAPKVALDKDVCWKYKRLCSPVFNPHIVYLLTMQLLSSQFHSPGARISSNQIYTTFETLLTMARNGASCILSCTFSGKMDKCKDLSEFDKDQIVMARPLDQSISKTAALVGCSRSAVVSIYQKWSKEGTVVNRPFVFSCANRIGDGRRKKVLRYTDLTHSHSGDGDERSSPPKPGEKPHSDRGRHSESSLSTYPYLLHPQSLHPIASYPH
ncbi:hypothetical protein QTP70_010154 [Hemibagrus guttatus]|uniref:Uncharacterized protein n=1 Tax=Hemibagrus guttatus TaxID=175788 RepID=A0AAE0PVD8_9TELE|nr:hypothetical protein QTP70_010154 [Hemibagrus guttatus]